MSIQKALNTAKTALAIANGVKMLLNIEIKYYDYALSAVNITNTGTVYQLTDIDQGDTVNQRNADRIKLQSISARFSTLANASAQSCLARILLIADTQVDPDFATIPTPANILEAPTLFQHMNMDNSTRFYVMKEWLIQMSAADTGMSPYYQYYEKFGDYHVDYSGTEGTNLGVGQLYLLVIGNQTANFPTLTGTFRLRFIDN